MTDDKDYGAGLIGQPIPTGDGTLPRPIMKAVSDLRDIGADCQRGAFGPNLAERLWDIADNIARTPEWRENGFAGEPIPAQPSGAPQFVAMMRPNTAETKPRLNYEEARVRAWRAVRLLEPSMEAYEAAMSVYVAAFGPHPGEVEVVVRG